YVECRLDEELERLEVNLNGVHFTFGANLADERPELNLRAERAKPNGLCSLSATAPALSEVERVSLVHSGCNE
ncbi:hypothetical protein ACFLXQ_04585, partial [Chloroflexota bacterium]